MKTFAIYLFFVVILGAIAMASSGCGGSGGKDGSNAPGLAGSQEQQAANLLSQIQDYHEQGSWRRLLNATGAMIDYHRDDPRCGEALVMAIPAALRLGQGADALELARTLRSDFPQQPKLLETLLKGVDLAVASSDTLTAATFQLMAIKQDRQSVFTDLNQPVVLPLLDGLKPAQLALLADDEPDPGLAGILGLHRVRALLRLGRSHDAAGLVPDLQPLVQTDPWAREAVALAEGRTLLSAAESPAGTPSVVLGLLAPLSGRYAGYGNAMSEAVRLAIREGSVGSPILYTIEERDTGGDPVQAVGAARELCSQPDVDVLVGALTTGSTVAAALIATEAHIPLISPNASNERIESLGSGIFQTNMNDQRELKLLADLASIVLLKQRIAILGPDTPNGHHLADLFREQVQGVGGQVIAEAFFPPAVTDFRAQILSLRKERPDVVFVPATFEQMALLGPQLDFHHLGCLVLGPSTWSRSQPSKQQLASFEGVIFPDAQARFPATWIAGFQQDWDRAAYAAEQTAVALRTYLAVRQVMSCAEMVGQAGSGTLMTVLQEKLHLHGERFEEIDLKTFAKDLLLIRSGKTSPFPADLFEAAFFAVTDSIAVPEEPAPVATYPAAEDSSGLNR